MGSLPATRAEAPSAKRPEPHDILSMQAWDGGLLTATPTAIVRDAIEHVSPLDLALALRARDPLPEHGGIRPTSVLDRRKAAAKALRVLAAAAKEAIDAIDQLDDEAKIETRLRLPDTTDPDRAIGISRPELIHEVMRMAIGNPDRGFGGYADAIEEDIAMAEGVESGGLEIEPGSKVTAKEAWRRYHGIDDDGSQLGTYFLPVAKKLRAAGWSNAKIAELVMAGDESGGWRVPLCPETIARYRAIEDDSPTALEESIKALLKRAK